MLLSSPAACDGIAGASVDQLSGVETRLGMPLPWQVINCTTHCVGFEDSDASLRAAKLLSNTVLGSKSDLKMGFFAVCY